MHGARMTRVLVLGLVACSSSPATPPATVDAAITPPLDAPAAIEPLRVTSLGVQGFALAYGDELVLTAPMFTRQSGFLVTIGAPLDIDTAAVDTGLAELPLDKLRAVVSGHAHYDHLLDVPYILTKAPAATLFANRSAQHIFAAL